MGGIMRAPKVTIPEPPPPPKPVATMDDDAVRRAGDDEALRMAARRGSTDTMLTSPTARRTGGLAGIWRSLTGGNPNA